VVEFVRSCYIGQWRLFKDRPDILTTGRYVRAPEGTPHFPGWHNLWSSNWVADAETPPEPPDLGEVSTGFRPWDNGAYRYAYPPAVVLGPGDCLSAGETFPAVPTIRQTLDGFPAACWTAAGQMPPDPLPVNWFEPNGLDAYGDTDPITSWAGLSGLGELFQQPDTSIAPVKGNDGTYNYAEFTQHSVLNLKKNVELCDAFQLFIVANITPEFAVTFLSCGLTYPGLSIQPTRWVYGSGLSAAIFFIPGGATGLALICLGRKGNQMQASRGVVSVETSPQLSQVHRFLSEFAAVALYRRVIPPIFNVVLPVQVYEVIAFDTWLTDAQFSGWGSYLSAKYGV